MFMRFFFWRDGIVSAAAPRVTTQDSFNSEIKPFNKPMCAERFNRVLRAGRTVAADAGQNGRKKKQI